MLNFTPIDTVMILMFSTCLGFSEGRRPCFDQFVPSIPDTFNITSSFQVFSRFQVIFPSVQFHCNGIITQLMGWYQIVNDLGIVKEPVSFQIWHPINQSHYELVSEVSVPPATNMTAIMVSNLSLPFYNGSVVGMHLEFLGEGGRFHSIKRDVDQFSAPRAYYIIGTKHCVADVTVGNFQSLYLPEVVISYDIIEEDVNVTLTTNNCDFTPKIEKSTRIPHTTIITIITSTTSVIIFVAIVTTVVGCYCWKKRKPSKPRRRDTYESSAYWNPDSVFSSMFYYRLESVLNGSMVLEDTTSSSYMTIDDSFNPNEAPFKCPATGLEQICLQLSHVEIPKESIKLGDEIGSGQFGTVLHGMWDHNGCIKQVAIKTLHGQATDEGKVKLLKESAIIEQFGHRNIVKLYGVLTDGNPMIVLEYLSNGDLLNYLLAAKPKKGDVADQRIAQTLLGFARDVGRGMNYLSNKCFIHRDLAARNILLAEDNVCKIADFGMSRDLEDGNYYVTKGGYVPLKWTAPEALLYRTYTTASDVWSYGILLYEMWSLGHKPFADFDNTEVVDLLDSGYRLPPPPGCPRFIYSLMMQCWNSQHKLRPGFTTMMRAISQPSYVLFHWFEEDKQIAGPECDVIGAPIEAGHNLYQDLQNTYR